MPLGLRETSNLFFRLHAVLSPLCAYARASPCHVRVGHAAGSLSPPIRPGTGSPSVRRPSWVPGLTPALASLRVYARASLSRLAPSATGPKPYDCAKTLRAASVGRRPAAFRSAPRLVPCSRALRASPCHASRWAHGRVDKPPFREKCRWACVRRPTCFFGSMTSYLPYAPTLALFVTFALGPWPGG